jgi:hypothetical protein
VSGACSAASKVGHIKTKLPSAKAPLPKFRSDAAAAKYFETYSVAEAWDQLPEAKPAAPSKALANSIRRRHAAAKSPISRRSCECGLQRGFAARRSGRIIEVTNEDA